MVAHAVDLVAALQVTQSIGVKTFDEQAVRTGLARTRIGALGDGLRQESGG